MTSLPSSLLWSQKPLSLRVSATASIRKHHVVACSHVLQDEQMMVDVHFLTGTETTGFNLHINGEGAGVKNMKKLYDLFRMLEIRLKRCQILDPFE